jgi:DNA-binding MarR family transcriptional regulator
MNFSDQFLASCRAAKESKLNCLSHLIVLIHLSKRENGAFCTNLAAEAKISTAATTGILDTLERMNLVRRQHDPMDRRTVRVHITDAGREALAKILP